eukprot:275827_1
MSNNEDQIFQKLIKCIEMTQSGRLDLIKKAESTLESEHQSPRFGVLLLKLLTQSNIPTNIKLGASIYFKNYVKRYWGKDEEIISQSDQTFIKTAIVRVMLQADKNTQRILSEAITIIASHDFYTKWDTLLPELIEKLKSEQNFENICGVLRIIESITCRYPDKEKTLPMVNEIKYILELFQDIWLQILAKWSAAIVESFTLSPKNNGPPQKVVQGGSASINQMKFQILSVQQLVLIFYDLNCVDLIAFFENNMSSWVKIYEALLKTTDQCNIFNTTDDIPGPIDQLRTVIVRALKLFNSKYEEEYSKYVATFVQHICGLLTTINDSERYDHLAAESIGYLSSVASQQWNASLFSKTSVLNDIVQRILIRNIRLRESDINMYEMNGEDWIRRDMEGSDLYTRRRGAVDLVRGLLVHFEADISTIIISQISQLMKQYGQDPVANYIDKDTAIHLILAVSIKGATKLLGATKLNQHVPVMQFFTQHILPELQSGKSTHPIILSDCLKFVITFRSQWPLDNFLQLLGMAGKYLSCEDYVLHTYAAIAIDKILAMKVYDEAGKVGRFKYPKKLMVEKIHSILIALFTVLNTREESQTNEYVMKCIMRVISRAEEGCVSVIEPVMKQCCIILSKVSKNPQKPTFNHYMFECIAALIRFASSQSTTFESQLMGPFLQILEMEQASEFHPYIYQIIGLMVRIRGSVDRDYAGLFDKLLETSLWNNDGNIVAISGTFADYLRLVKVESFVDDRRLNGMLGIFQHLLSKRTADYHAFRILSAVFEYVALPKLSQYLKQIIELVCIRIRAKKSTALCCHFVISLSVFVVKHGVAALVEACNQLQSGIFVMILEKIWLVYARNVTDLMDRKMLTCGMITLCASDAFKSDQRLFKLFPNIINCVVEIFEAGPLQSNEQKTADFYISRLEEQGAATKFVGLTFAKSPPHDVTKAMGMPDPRLLLIQSVASIIGNNQQIKRQFASNSKPIICKTINGYAQRFNVNFSLPVTN